MPKTSVKRTQTGVRIGYRTVVACDKPAPGFVEFGNDLFLDNLQYLSLLCLPCPPLRFNYFFLLIG